MTEVSVKTCFANLKVLSFSSNSWLARYYQDTVLFQCFLHELTEDDRSFCQNMFYKLESFVVSFKEYSTCSIHIFIGR